jgi:hypothetical protein
VLRGGLGTGNAGISDKGVTFERQAFQHHGTMRSLEESEAIVGCSICQALANELRKHEELLVAKDEHMGVVAQIHQFIDRDSLAIRRVSESVAESSRMYQLDFIHQETKTILRTFALKPASKSISKIPSGRVHVLLLHAQGSFRTFPLYYPDFIS